MNDIKSIVEGKLGLTDMQKYVEYKKRIWETPVSLEEIEELSPDKVDSSEFWKYCDENPEFKYDTISFGVQKNGSISEANSRNFDVAASMGAFSILPLLGRYTFDALDIGAGFGMMKEALRRFAPAATYYGVDVHPKFEGCIKVTDCILPPNIMEKKFGLVFACNVFQHLSIRQRRTYYEQISKILHQGGFFVLTNAVDQVNGDEKRRGFKCKDNDRRYMVHYGQFTEVQTLEELQNDLSKHFDIHSVFQRLCDSYFCFNLTYKKVY